MMNIPLVKVLAALLAASAWAATPTQMTYQGRLRESNAPVTGVRQVNIYLCDAPVAGTCTPTGEQAVTVTNSLFRTVFPVPSSVNLQAGTWYLEVRLGVGGTTTLSPREELTASPYSMVAGTATTVVDGVISSGKIADGAVVSGKLALNSVATGNLQGGAVTGVKLADGSVASAKIADGGIASGKLAAAAVLSANIQDGAVTSAKLADGAVSSAKIADGGIVSGKLGPNSVAAANIADGAVTSSKLADGSVSSGKIADGGIATGKLADGSVASSKLQDSAVTFAKLADGAVSSDKIQAGGIASGKLAPNAVLSANIQDGSITTAKLADGSVTSAKLDSEARIPSGAVMHFNLAACPLGWTELIAARGRYLVGLPLGGTLAGTVGTALSNLEDRPVGQHSHGVTDPGHSHNQTATANTPLSFRVVGTSFGNTADAPMASAATGISINNAGAVTGTNAPMIQLLTCQKN